MQTLISKIQNIGTELFGLICRHYIVAVMTVSVKYAADLAVHGWMMITTIIIHLLRKRSVPYTSRSESN